MARTYRSRRRSRWRRYVPVAQRVDQAGEELARLREQGRQMEPVTVEGRTIAHTFWGQGWCDNLESFSDYENRLPRGRTYLRRGAVIDLQIGRGEVKALVVGSELYEVNVGIKLLSQRRWKALQQECAGEIGSLVELLRGEISNRVMDIVSRPQEGLFPRPSEITLRCSCPDWAVMCKHVAAALYGVGARLDSRPELLFELRGGDPLKLTKEAAPEVRGSEVAGERLLQGGGDELAALFGVELEPGEAEAEAASGGNGAGTTAQKSDAEEAAPAVRAEAEAQGADDKTAPRPRREATQKQKVKAKRNGAGAGKNGAGVRKKGRRGAAAGAGDPAEALRRVKLEFLTRVVLERLEQRSEQG